ncbi:MAG: MBL fold metallo-hydrolase [Pseudomonadota bacterium]
MKKILLLIGLAIIGGVAFVFFSPSAQKQLQLAAVDRIGDAAVSRMENTSDTDRSPVAAQFISIPIEAREISAGVYQATGVGNVQLIKTSEGDVLFDTGLALQTPKQIEALANARGDAPLRYIVLSHSHADHTGGAKLWAEKGTKLVAHAEFPEEQRYLTELQQYFWNRNRTLFPFLGERPPMRGPLAYGGLEPDLLVQNGAPLDLSMGGVSIEVIAAPGAEGADNLLLWLPEKKILFSGDFFGPLFPQFPNIFTMRGEKIRKPIEYINSLQTVIGLQPEIIVPSHLAPQTDMAAIMDGLVKMRDAVQYVHDETVKGMNAGKSVYDLMAEVTLPEALSLSQEHGRVSWAVKSIWEYYATWFHFDRTTELYEVPASAVASDLVEASGAVAIVSRARAHFDAGRPLHALHLVDVVLENDPQDPPALELRADALNFLLERAKSELGNAYEIYWLTARLRTTRAAIAAL